MLYVFVGALVLGGIILGASLLVGDGHGDASHDLGVHVDGDGIDVIVGAFRSMRFWTFFLTFFGLTGTIFLTLGITESRIVATGVATALGLFAGWAVVWAFRTLNRKEANSISDERDLIGQSGRILVAVSPTALGKIRLQVKGSTVDMLAKSDESLAIESEAIVIEMDGTMVRVATMETGASAVGRGD